MDEARFEALARLVGAARTRRGALGRLAAGVAVAAAPGLALRAGAAEVGPEGQIIPGCRLVGQRCRNGGDCCSGRCGGRRQCRCLNKGASCLVTVKGGLQLPVHANCCSNRCNNQNICQ